MKTLYPLLFENNFHNKIWGGHRLKPMKGLPWDDEPIGESWEISAVPGSESIVSNGVLKGWNLAELTSRYGADLLGERVMEQYNGVFPLLVKFIDAEDDLSIQVHPNDKLAMERHHCFGKTEMWYVLDAKPGAKLYSGFRSQVSKYEYEKRIEDGSICDVLQSYEVKAGDVFFIPSGRVHAICGGILLAEVQQSSDITYRIYDYNRPGLDGKMRQLHTDLAKDAIDFKVLDDYTTHYAPKVNKPVGIVETAYFVVKILNVDRAFHRKLYKYDSFVIYMCVDGECRIEISSGQSVMLTQGYSCLIPACVADYNVVPCNDKGVTKVLECYIDNKNF